MGPRLDDVRSAFPSVNIDLAVADYSLLLGDTAAISTGRVDAVRRRSTSQSRPGPGLSVHADALNLHLHHAYDVHAHGLGIDQAVPLLRFRYADNLVAACRDISEGQPSSPEWPDDWRPSASRSRARTSRPVDLRQGRLLIHIVPVATPTRHQAG